MERVLVVGGTGRLGLPVVRRLVADGFSVRVLSRRGFRSSSNPSVESLTGDVANLETAVAAVRGMDRLHISLSSDSEQRAIERTEDHKVASLLQALEHRTTIKQISYLSGMYVRPEAKLSPTDKAKFAARNAVIKSGIAYTIFRPTYFMDTMPLQIRGSNAIIIGRQRRPIRMVAADDFATMVSRGFRTELALNKEFDVRGPEAITFDEAFSTYLRYMAPHVRVKHVSISMMSLINTMFLKGKLSREIQVMSQMERLGDLPCENDASDILGRAKTTVREWCVIQSKEPPTA